MITDEMVKVYWDTHDWIRGNELPICRACSESPISLGIWGDNRWRDENRKWEKPCQGKKEEKDGNSNESG